MSMLGNARLLIQFYSVCCVHTLPYVCKRSDISTTTKLQLSNYQELEQSESKSHPENIIILATPDQIFKVVIWPETTINFTI